MGSVPIPPERPTGEQFVPTGGAPPSVAPSSQPISSDVDRFGLGASDGFGLSATQPVPAWNDQRVAFGYREGVRQRDGVLILARCAFGANGAKRADAQFTQDTPVRLAGRFCGPPPARANPFAIVVN